MSFDLYGPCPCGSGKKFKWCCQPIGAQIEKAFEQNAEGQHDTALRLMEQLTTDHPDNPEAWGRKAQLLYQNERVDEAENALQKALAINPNYAFGYLLRGQFRQHEGEIAGALLLYRKAAELYDPEAKEVVSQVYSLIGESELKLNRPVAAHAAFKQALRFRPSEELQKAIDQVFGDESQLPVAARRDYAFESPPSSATPDRRAAWNRALAGAATGKLSDAARAFEQLTAENAEDATAWYNLALVRSWNGDSAAALDALDRYISLETDENRAAAAWTLGEVLRFGQGMEDRSDHIDYSALFQIRNPQQFFDFLQTWQKERRLVGVQVREQEGVISGLLLDRGGLLTGGPASQARIGANLLVMGNLVRLANTNSEGLDRAAQELVERAGSSVSEPRRLRGPANFADVLADAVIIPLGAADQAQAAAQVREHVQRYYEDTWPHRSLRSLGGVAPIDAAGHQTLRKKLLGVIAFIQQCAAGEKEPYDFDRLRRKLGLLGSAAQAAPADGAAKAPAIADMSAAELAALAADKLGDDQLEQAYRTAQKLDAQELAKHFALALVARPAQPERSDRFPIYTYLVQRALAEGDADAALNHVNEGEKDDCEHNEGRRRNDYELRRAQVLVKRGEADSAREVFERLIDRAPAELRFRGTATESMLAAKQGAHALRFAEQGLSKAREKNDRDSEQYFMELVAAARKQVG
jgi:tetratricopeptide (TPR) repeat protein